jgi:ElaB/YqjD/DUF883 family membrane-anchored ribosome-binding protein
MEATPHRILRHGETMASTNPTPKPLEQVGDSAHEVVDRVTETAEQWLEMKDDWVDGARVYVREHPIAALGIAAAAGYMLSILLRSRG